MRILILTDSVALPREKPEKCQFKDTYPILLQEKHTVHQVSIGGATSTDLLDQIHYHLSFKPDLLILQFGIVDCVPRFVSKKELYVLRRIPFIGKFTLKLLNRQWIRKKRKITYVSPAKFRYNLIQLYEISQDSHFEIYFIAIIPGTKDYENNVPGVIKRIQQYNQIANDIFGRNFINLNNFPHSGIMSDNHHINSIGHKFIKNNIDSKLQSK